MNLFLGIGQITFGALLGGDTLTAAGLHNISDYQSYKYKAKALKTDIHELEEKYRRRAAFTILGAGALTLAYEAAFIDEHSEDIDRLLTVSGVNTGELIANGLVAAEIAVAGLSILELKKEKGGGRTKAESWMHVLGMDVPAALFTTIGVVGGNLINEKLDTVGLFMHAGMTTGVGAMMLKKESRFAAES